MERWCLWEVNPVQERGNVRDLMHAFDKLCFCLTIAHCFFRFDLSICHM